MFAAYGLLKDMVLHKRHLENRRSGAYHLVSDGSAGHFVQTLKKAVKKNEERALHHSITNCVQESSSRAIS